MLADEQTRAQILAVLGAWVAAVETKDVDAVMAICIPDEDLLLVGTGADEIRRGPAVARAGFERDYRQADRVSVSHSDISVSAAGDAAWLFSQCEAKVSMAGQTITMCGRNTMTFERRGGCWLVAQAHLSLPAFDQEEGHSYIKVERA